MINRDFRDRLTDLAGGDGQGRAIIADLSSVPRINDNWILRSVLRIIQDHIGATAHEIFPLDHFRLAFLAKADAARDVRTALQLVSDHLVAHRHGGILFVEYHLPRDLAALGQALQPLANSDTAPRAKATAAPDPISLDDLDQLIDIDRMLHGTDVSSLIRQQSVWRLIKGNEPTAFARELWVSISALELWLKIGIADNPWLFARATEILDRRILNYLIQERASYQQVYAVNLHPTSLESPEFDKLTDALGPRGRSNLIVELPYIEIASDPGLLARALRRLDFFGLRPAFDNVPWAALAELRPSNDVAYLKVEAREVPAQPVAGDASAQAIGKIGADRIVVHHCSEGQALDMGWTYGLSLFQGRGIDARIDELTQATAAAAKPKEARRDGEGDGEEEGEPLPEAEAEGDDAGRGTLGGLFARLTGKR